LTTIEPFHIDVPASVLDDLADRLNRTRWPDQVPGVGWDHGIPLDYLEEVCRYWARDYDWRQREKALNRFPQYRTTIDGLGLHFVHARSPEPTALPIVITHGWPGSIVEFQKVIGPLSNPAAHGGDPADAFHVICPSLPGFGFSDRPAERGWDTKRTAAAWSELMARLGYDRYGAQGGDWGAVVTTDIALHDPSHCAAIHLNMPLAPPDPETMNDLTEGERASLASMKHYDDFDSGYMKLQSTRPQTLAYGLTDSPAGQAGWILEKFWSWTDCDGHPENALTRDELLDNVMLYWVPATGGSSARMYYEVIRGASLKMSPVTVPTGVAIFPKELIRPSRRWAEKRYNVVHWSEKDRGGHFAAFEQPELYVDEVRTFFRAFR
jgi:pimeloyl-ACP methyl ester carboxylesterase